MAEFVKVAKVSEIPPGSSRCVLVGNKKVALFNVDGEFFAIDDMCSHAEASLSEGTFSGEEVTCPRHGARFNVKTGEALSMPAWAPVDTFQVKVEGDDILIAP